jgi:hypothetical protein
LLGLNTRLELCWIVVQRLFLAAAGRLRPEGRQSFAGEVEVHQGEAGEHAVGILGRAFVSDPVESELPLHDSKYMFDLGSHLRLGAVLAPL